MGGRALLLAAALTLVGVACSGGDADEPAAATVPSASVESTTSTTVGVDEVPDEITVEYVQRVMDALDASWGDMYRLYVASGGPTLETNEWLAELYTPDEYSVMEIELGREAAAGFEDTRSTTGEPTTEVQRLISSGDQCVYFEGVRHYAEVFEFVADPARTRGAVAITRREGPTRRNSTTWRITFEADATEGLPSEEPCE